MPSPLSREDVAHLANLARIDLSEAELERLGAELPQILDHVAAVQEAAAADVEAMSHPQPISNVFREDVVTPGLTPDEALSGAPESEEQRFSVPRILGEE
ncbi:Asp-tRNA(Asn)/Glu-tRNA(Gln) amidotransferase subunit GatC [Aeromicrobium halocynthiae]|uniref:Aspartyl/glutamyl-tRNA(Asn/Gln) amidotransferase subunit C n=1 Tax=Aeromicrobium halocynthiae TaxID=560557 RepID=A0ABN2W6B2_9ACTN